LRFFGGVRAATAGWYTGLVERTKVRYLTVGIVAKRLGCSETWVRLLELHGRLRPAAIAGDDMRLYLEEDVAAFKARERRGA
jgi:hypothetical protein